MNEASWLSCADPGRMLAWVVAQPGDRAGTKTNYVASPRNLRLFACACLRARGGARYYGIAGMDEVEVHADAGTEPWPYRRPDGTGRDRNAVSGILYLPAAEMAAVVALPTADNLLPQPQKADLLREIVGNPWIQYRWSDNDEPTFKWPDSSLPRGDCQDSAAQARHAEGLDQGVSAGRVEDAGSMGMGAGGRPSGAGRISDPSHQRRQHGRQADQSGPDPSRGTPSVPRRETAGEAGRPEVPAYRYSLRSMQGGISGSETEPHGNLSGMSQGNQKKTSSRAVSTNGKVVLLDGRWLTPTVLSLARAAYEERGEDGHLDLVRLAVLSDSLEEAGVPEYETCPDCQDESEYRIYCKTCKGSGNCGQIRNPLLAHLRSPGPHLRGCHVLDLLLGKS